MFDRFEWSVIKQWENGVVEMGKRGKHSNHKSVRSDREVKNDIRAHINKFYRIESHYLRVQTSREFIDGGLTIAIMHTIYKTNCYE